MIKFKTMLCIIPVFIMLQGCNGILEPVLLSGNTKETLGNVQEEFNINIKALTSQSAVKANKDPYSRELMITGSGTRANVFTESDFLSINIPRKLKNKNYILGKGDKLTFEFMNEFMGDNVKWPPMASSRDYILGKGDKLTFEFMNEFMGDNVKWPPMASSRDYILGKGDQLTFIQVKDSKNTDAFFNSSTGEIVQEGFEGDKVLSTKGIIGSDGNILLLGIGNISVEGKTLSNVQTEVRNLFIENGLTPNFQLEITDFQSKKAYLIQKNISTKVLPLNNSSILLKQLILNIEEFVIPTDALTVITLKRSKEIFRIPLEKILDFNTPDIWIQDNDQIEIDHLKYKPGQVYALSGAGSAKIIPIAPSKRETLADVLFTEEGALKNLHAKRSEIYLLRGEGPVDAYHLDAQNVSRILVAAKTELRPNDIIYVADRPIISFSRLLSEITPLRMLLRDVKDSNIP